ncbi:hypothetical protein JRI60_27195 [Archangium violaceum]|uniref:hypothetical protein n=1 Tax=Archangium violaceum TaxID=83451 RepID=UPI00194E0D78|nr:hypothetical protein [Archangium violaceum]QRN92899.1 hypothetical protein JRI60_27195 [Archangium violaceum]
MIVQCSSCQKWQRFSSTEQRTGLLLSDEDVNEFKAFRSYVDPKETAGRVDKYVTWLFGGTVTLGALLGVFTNVGGSLTAAGKLIVGVAVVFMALSLRAAVQASTPIGRRVNPYSLDDLQAGYREKLEKQLPALGSSAAFFGIALVMVGLAPSGGALLEELGRAMWPASLETAYSFDAKTGTVTVTAQGSHLFPYEMVDLEIVQGEKPEVLVNRIRKQADAQGQVQLSLPADRVEQAKTPLVARLWREHGERVVQSDHVVGPKKERLPLELPPSAEPSVQVAYTLNGKKLQLSVSGSSLTSAQAYELEVKQGARTLGRSRVTLKPDVPSGSLSLDEQIDLSKDALVLMVMRDTGNGTMEPLFQRELPKETAPATPPTPPASTASNKSP